MTYEEIRKQRCEWCAKDVRKATVNGILVHRVMEVRAWHGKTHEPCTAPTAEQVIEELSAQLNTPELHAFTDGVISEAQHQRHKWGSGHDAGKQPEDWFWLLGYLGGKALASLKAGDTDKALHHTISSAAVLANWHAAILGQTNMRPGIDPARHGITPSTKDSTK
jgi:hypothetical protein